jgi:pectate lyase
LSNSSTQTTISWALFDGENAAECRSRHLRSNELVDSEATYHHSFWRHVDGRAPFVHGATARAHLYNNVVLDAVDYAVGSGCHAQVLLEGSYFEEVAAPSNIRDCVETPGLLGLISATAGSNLYGTGTGTHKLDGTASQEPRDSVFIPPYTYRLEPAAEIRFRVQERAGAGSRWALPLNKN